MYGLVNKAVKEMVVSQHGIAIWEQIRDQAGVDDVFISMDSYPEDVTDKLVMAASVILGASAHTILTHFGHYWVGFASRHYDYVMDMSGKNFLEFIKNLNNMHSRIGQWMPDLQPPSFSVTNEAEGSFTLHYYSSREGFTSMIEGLLAGIAERFDTKIAVEHVQGRAQGLDHEQFHVCYIRRQPLLAL